MKVTIVSFCLALAVLAITPNNACSFELLDNLYYKASEISQYIEQLEKRIVLLEKDSQQLKGQIESEKIASKHNYTLISSLRGLFPEIAIIDPTANTYSIIACPSGLFSISCDNIKPYSTGSEISFEVTNLLGTTVTGVKLNVEYSTEGLNDTSILSKHLKDLREKTSSISSIKSGYAVKMKVRIPEYKPDNLKYISVSVAVSGLSYHQQKQ